MTRRNAQDVRIYKIIGGDTEATFDDRQVFADRPSRVEAARQIKAIVQQNSVSVPNLRKSLRGNR